MGGVMVASMDLVKKKVEKGMKSHVTVCTQSCIYCLL